MALDDAWRRGLVKDLSAWQDFCGRAAGNFGAADSPKPSASKGPLAMALEVTASCVREPAHKD